MPPTTTSPRHPSPTAALSPHRARARAQVVTNQVTADPGNMFVPDAKKPVGGNILAHMVTTRINLKKGKDCARIAKVYSGPLPETEATFVLAAEGITDL